MLVLHSWCTVEMVLHSAVIVMNKTEVYVYIYIYICMVGIR